MKNKRFADYLARTKDSAGMSKEDIAKNPDNKIDQAFKGYPDGTAKDETVKPKTKTQKKTADLGNKDGEKKSKSKKTEIDEQESDGSANAFDDK
ncbi:MAG: hypothetical protein ABI480_13755 [Chitinophagaceae bacterium]